GIVSWATRGIHLGYQRNYFNVHVDDVFLPDSRWSVSGNCTPGDDCIGNVTTTDIRMTAADVTKLVAWQTAHGFKLDMVFNADGSVLAGGATDPLTTAFLANKAQFPWINHTYSHQYLGCIQIAPTVVGQTWHCATSPTEVPRQDPEIPQTLSGTLYWHSEAGITGQVSQNIAWAAANGLTSPNFDPKELVTGEHSGLASLPQMPTDNPFLVPALSALGVKYTASDASREVEPRTLAGGVTVTVPRHPTNIYYNAGLFQDEVDEYNWYYTSKANGGSGICEGNASSTCITPLAAGDNAAAATSFNTYIKPIEVRNALKYVLTNDPRPFYAHQSNLAQDAVLYPVVEGVLGAYNGVYNTSTTPIKQTNMTGQYQAMSRISGWKAVNGAVDGYVDSAGVHVPTSSAAVPVTVPAASTGGTLEAYAGSLSGWVSGGATITPPTPAGGYLVKAPATAPGAPTIGTAAPGSTTATVAWTAPASDGGSAITGYTVRGYVGAATTPSITANVAAGLTGTVVTGLTNGTSYRFDVAAVNTVGTGAYSAISAAVTPNVALAPVPGNATAKPGNASATVTWVAPTTTSGVTGYQIRAFAGASTTASKTVTVAASRLTASVTGLTNGTGYTFDVSSLYGTSAGPASARSVAVTPSLISQAPGAPSIAGVAPANTAATVTWVPPVDSGAGTPSGYRVAAYVGTGTSAARTVTVAGTASTATMTGLTNGTGYTFEVTVQYSAGNGPISARSAAVVPAPSAPSAPVIGTAASGSTGGTITATAQWSAPANTGGSAITGYQVNAMRLAADGSVLGTTTSGLRPSSARSYSMTLPVGGQYVFTVVAVNAAGTSAPSATSNPVTGR
ncbi:MAG TPA: fibronectin type III domain-containing protein, partial [Kineosporiaceae bacterium]|nr:fibronectin type III domain-containing protein [Kineosporiaceae bacterium]